MIKSVEPVFFDYMTNIGEKKIDEPKLIRIAEEFKKIVADTTLQLKGV